MADHDEPLHQPVRPLSSAIDAPLTQSIDRIIEAVESLIDPTSTMDRETAVHALHCGLSDFVTETLHAASVQSATATIATHRYVEYLEARLTLMESHVQVMTRKVAAP